MIGIILWAIVIFILAVGYFDNLWLVLVILACSFIAVILDNKCPITKAGKEEKKKRGNAMSFTSKWRKYQKKKKERTNNEEERNRKEKQKLLHTFRFGIGRNHQQAAEQIKVHKQNGMERASA